EYKRGSWVTLEIPGQRAAGKPRPVRAQVKFVRLPRSPHELYQVGVELENPGNVWGVQMPPEDWLQFSGYAAAAGLAATGTAMAPAPAAEIEDASAAERTIDSAPESDNIERAIEHERQTRLAASQTVAPEHAS